MAWSKEVQVEVMLESSWNLRAVQSGDMLEVMWMVRRQSLLFHASLVKAVGTGRVAEDIELSVRSKKMKVLAECRVHVGA